MDKEQFAYSKLQESAQHNDHMAWLISSILFFATVYLLIFILRNLEKNSFIILTSAFFGFLLILINLILFQNAQQMKWVKYDQCKMIEEIYGFKNQSLRAGGFGRYFYYTLIAILGSFFFVIFILFLDNYL